jgi:phage repressor protein C with HTH and peptisase S24 domain
VSWPNVGEKLRRGESVTMKPQGNSMTPRIKSGQLVTIEPATIEQVEVGDVALAKVKGKYWLHLVSAMKDGRVQISNNHGHVNGWTNRVFGKVVGV